MTTAKTTLAVAMALVTLAAPALAAEEAGLSMTLGAQTSAKLSVTGTAGRYDSLASTTLQVSVQLNAELEVGSRKIVASELLLRQADAGSAEPVSRIAKGAAPSKSIDISQTVELALSHHGAIARDAIAACASNGAPTLSVPLVWRVTTGRFNFRWTDYDHVAPTQEFADNPDFYGERATAQRELALTVAVDCAPLPAAGVAQAMPPKSATRPPMPAPNSAKRAAVDTAAVRKVDFVPAETVAAAQLSAPVCQGGMVREFGAGEGYLCLCPGNTTRVASGDNAFSCERRVRRK